MSLFSTRVCRFGRDIVASHNNDWENWAGCVLIRFCLRRWEFEIVILFLPRELNVGEVITTRTMDAVQLVNEYYRASNLSAAEYEVHGAGDTIAGK